MYFSSLTIVQPINEIYTRGCTERPRVRDRLTDRHQWSSQEIFPGGANPEGLGTEVTQWGPGAKPPDADDFTMKK